MSQREDKIIHIGFDDTDSLKGNCTTYLATLIIEKISAKTQFLDYPRLIRNNPNVPWKTRGNGAIALTLKTRKENVREIITNAEQIIRKRYEHEPETNPGFVVIEGEIPKAIKNYSKKTLTEIIEHQETRELIRKYCSYSFYIGNGRGLIGALAAIGNTLNPIKEDFTYELLTYRIPKNWGTERKLDETSVFEMDTKLKPYVFNNIDEEKGNVLIAPSGKDPVLYGIRGEGPEILLEAFQIVKTNEKIERYCIFRTNQGTDQHFKFANSTVKEFSVFKGIIEVLENPTTKIGGHVFFPGRVKDNSTIVDVAAFEPTKNFRNIIRKLIKGDLILAFGGIQYKKDKDVFTIQLEKCEIKSIVKKIKTESPFCPDCKKRMTSAGYKKGYKCKNCGFKGRNMKKIRKEIKRSIVKKVYIPPAGAQRHLVKPIQRYELPRNNEVNLIKDWWKTYYNNYNY